MIRSFIVILLLAVFFLSGTLYGMDRDTDVASGEQVSALQTKSDQQEAAKTSAEVKDREAELEKIKELQAAQMDEPSHFTEKTASFLETAVKGFYEVVVEILYQISSLFY